MRKSFLASALALGVGIALSAYGQASVANGAAEAQASSANVESVAATSELDWDAAPEPGTLKTVTVDGVEYAFRYCPAGTFTMGSPSSESGRDDDETQHEVTLDGFWMLETEVTQAMWKSLMGKNPSWYCSSGGVSSKVSGLDTSNFPVDNVSWDDCQDFIKKLNSLGVAPNGFEFRLPSEAEWEYACRAGTTGPYAGSSLDSLGWYWDNSGRRTHEVGKKTPNVWGLHDMHGNVLEWCADWYDSDYYKKQNNAQNPINVTPGSYRVLRGGNWCCSAWDCRSAIRTDSDPSYGSSFFGFRLALVRAVDAPETDVSDENSDVAWDAEPKARTRKTLTVDGVEYAFRYCPAGTFTMGSPESESGRDHDETQHRVELTNGFWMLETEVTQAMWKSLMGENPSCFCSSGNGSSEVSGLDTSNFPVERVSWNDCQVFIKELNSLGVAPNGFEFRLPSEAEWEYACRAGTTGPYAGASLDALGWHAYNSGSRTHEVGTKTPNGWGLYDMHGNVYEWCADWYDAKYYEKSNNVQNPINVTQGSRRVLRGGSWYVSTWQCRSADRDDNGPTTRYNFFGFRLALVRAVDAATPVGDAVEGEIKFEEDDKQSSQEPKTDLSAAIQTALSDKKSNVAPETDVSDASSEDAPKTNVSDEDSDVAWNAEPKAGTRKTLTVDGVVYAFRYCPAGTFQMGSPASESGRHDNETQHEVTLTNGFWALETEVTQAMWKSVMGLNPSEFPSSERKPVDSVSWNDCQKFIKQLNSLGGAPEGFLFRLPTEAEWEYACRAGATGPYAGSSLDSLGWYWDNSGSRTREVGQKSANSWGLRDMHGNVFEWCEDLYADYDNLKSPQNPINATEGSRRVLRGGGWGNYAESCRSAYRRSADPTNRLDIYGFRLVLGRAVDAAAPVEDAVEDEIELAEDDKQSSQEPKTNVSDENSDVAPKTNASNASSEDAPKTNVSDASSEDAPKTNVSDENSDVAWDAASEAGTRKTLTVDGVEYAFRYCPTGTFQMGSPEGESGRGDDETPHRVELTNGFWMLETEVTQAMWKSLMGENPSWFCSSGSGSYMVSGLDTSNFPVERVSWDDCQDFIKKLNSLGVAPNGFQFRLPTEAEWEYACRAGSDTAYFWGDSLNGDKANCDGAYPYGTSTKGKRLGRTTAVGSYAPNVWGLRDMHGNVFEWCEDLYDAKYYEKPNNVQDPINVVYGSRRASRGGGWVGDAEYCRSAYRSIKDPALRYFDCGFRLALVRAVDAAAPVEDADENSDVAWDAASEAGTRQTLTVAGVEYAFRYCPAGTFMRGDDETQHWVELTNGFWMLETEVTQAMWKSLMGENPSYFCSSGYGSRMVSALDTSNFPVERVSWDDCQDFIKKLNSLGVAPNGFQFRLPTEAEWEYACRAGTAGPYAGSSLDSLGWYSDNSGSRTHEVGKKTANPWGLHDMHGNVFEWCEDLYADDYYKKSNNVQDPVNVTRGSLRASRGGSWDNIAERCRSAARDGNVPSYRNSDCGFRLALVRASSSK